MGISVHTILSSSIPSLSKNIYTVVVHFDNTIVMDTITIGFVVNTLSLSKLSLSILYRCQYSIVINTIECVVNIVVINTIEFNSLSISLLSILSNSLSIPSLSILSNSLSISLLSILSNSLSISLLSTLS